MVPAEVLEVPQYVLLHLAKGGKFIPSYRGSSHPAANSELDRLHRRLLLCKFFPDDNRNMTRCRSRSSWQPLSDSNVDIFMRLLKREFASYEFQTARANWSWLDRKALAWLAQHRDSIAVVDCDKGLGDALVPRAWIRQQVYSQLSQGFVQISDDEFQTRMDGCKQHADALVQFFRSSGTLSDGISRFLLGTLHEKRAGTFRILVKVHKIPTASRPICNLRGVWMAPFATFLVEQLNPLLSKLQSVVVSTDQLLEELSTTQCRPGMKFFTFDVVNLYPSVDRCHFLSVISGFLRTRMPNHSLCTFVIRALELILSACFVTFEGCKYESTDGIPTGLAVASIVANIYLWHLDCFIAEQAGELLQLIRRYVDDLLLLCCGSHQWLGEILHRWHPSLRFELSGSMEASRQVQYLDVNLGIQDDRSVTWSLFNKPQNLHLYIPACSNHPPAAFKSLQIGGFIRCQRRNRLSADAERSLAEFKRNLKQRGYSLAAFDKLVRNYKLKEAGTGNISSKTRKVFVKVSFNRGIQAS